MIRPLYCVEQCGTEEYINPNAYWFIRYHSRNEFDCERWIKQLGLEHDRDFRITTYEPTKENR